MIILLHSAVSAAALAASASLTAEAAVMLHLVVFASASVSAAAVVHTLRLSHLHSVVLIHFREIGEASVNVLSVAASMLGLTKVVPFSVHS